MDEESLREAIREFGWAEAEKLYRACGASIGRALELLKLAKALSSEDSASPVAEDVLRATVVFCHASLEILLRTLALNLHSVEAAEALEKIPLVGSTRLDRCEKFSLVALAKHRDKTVKELIEQSLREYYEFATFNSAKDICALFERLSINIDPFRPRLPMLQEMIERRHLIVHHADTEFSDANTSMIPIRLEMVEAWTVNLTSFFADCVAECVTQGRAFQEFANGLLKHIADARAIDAFGSLTPTTPTGTTPTGT